MSSTVYRLQYIICKKTVYNHVTHAKNVKHAKNVTHAENVTQHIYKSQESRQLRDDMKDHRNNLKN